MRLLHFAVRYCTHLVLGLLLTACAITEVTPQPSALPQMNVTPEPVEEASTGLTGKLVYVEAGSVYVFQDGNTTQLTDDSNTFSPAWSPDGTQIAVVRREESYSNIFLLDESGETIDQVTAVDNSSAWRSRESVHEVVWTDSPSWTPDGTAIVYLSQLLPATTEGENPALYEYPLSIFQYPLDLLGEREPSSEDVLVTSTGPDLQQPAWAPDESFLAYVRVPRKTTDSRQIMLFDPETNESQAYSGIPANSYDPVWSPDGNWLLFTAVVDGQTDVWVIGKPSEGGEPVRLTTTGQARAAAWSPDGMAVAYIGIDEQGSNLYALTLETNENGALSAGDVEQLTTSGKVDANSGASWAE